MAGNLKELKSRIKTASNISQIAKAMEMISASKIRKAKLSVENNRPYTEKIVGIMGKLLADSPKSLPESRYFTPSKSRTKLLVAISPDKGLCGALVENIAREFSKYPSSEYCLIVIGKKIERYALRHGYDIKASFNFGARLPGYDCIYPVLEVMDKLYIGGEVSEVSVLYSDFKSIFMNTPTNKKLLPVDLDMMQKGIPAQGYKCEPSRYSLLDQIIPHYTEVRLYNCLLNAYCSEQAARMVAMQNAKNNALDINEFLTLSYNKLRQEKITNEILDITNVMLA